MTHARTFIVCSVIAAFVACSADAPDASDSADAGSSSDATTSDAGAGDATVPSEAGADPIGEHSGARIKLTFEASSDGFRRRTGLLYDAQLDLACAPALSEDGQWRCLPEGASTAEVFTDPECKHRVAGLSECSPKPRYASAPAEMVSCGMYKRQVFELGAQVTPTTLYAHVSNGDGCATAPVAIGIKYFDVTAVPAATFAMLDQATHPLVPGLEAMTFETADGLRLVSQLRDVTHGARCQFANAADNQLRCVPPVGTAGIVGTLFSDESCQNAVAFSSCPDYSIASRYVGGCPGRIEVFSVGAQLATDAGVFRQTGTGCTPSSASNPRPVTGAIAPSELVPGAIVPAASGTRLRVDPVEVAPNIRFSSTSLVMTDPIHDAAKDTDCYPQEAADGKVRCLPSPAASAEVFADDQCTARVARVLAPSCGLPKFALQFVVTNASCGAADTHVYPLAAKRSTTVAYRRDASTGGSCVMEDLGAAADIYEIGPEIAPTEFAEVTTMHD